MSFDYNQNIGYIINESAIPGFTETNIVNQDVEGRVTAEAVLQVADEVNRNGRVYPFDELIPQINCPRIQELLEAGYLLGECGHPLATDLVRQQTIDPTKVCVRYLKLWNEGPIVKALYRGTNNSLGNMVNQDLLDGCKPAFSLRALGTIQKTPRGAEVHNLRIISWDMVVYPSHKTAYTQRIVSKNGSTNESVIGESALIEEPKTNLQKYYESYFKDSDNAELLDEQSRIIPITNRAVVDMIKNESANVKSVGEMLDFAYKSIELTPDKKKVKLVSESGDIAVVNLEKQIYNEIMSYCDKKNNLIEY